MKQAFSRETAKKCRPRGKPTFVLNSSAACRSSPSSSNTLPSLCIHMLRGACLAFFFSSRSASTDSHRQTKPPPFLRTFFEEHEAPRLSPCPRVLWGLRFPGTLGILFNISRRLYGLEESRQVLAGLRTTVQSVPLLLPAGGRHYGQSILPRPGGIRGLGRHVSRKRPHLVQHHWQLL